MSRKLFCDGCGHDAIQTNEEEHKWTILRTFKLSQPTTKLSDYEFCKDCMERIAALIARLTKPA